MSRIGRLPVTIPSGVQVTIDGREVTVQGPKGTLTHTVADPIDVVREDGVIRVTRPNDEGSVRALHGLSRTLMGSTTVCVSVPLGPFTVTTAPSMATSTPAGTGMGSRPIRDMA